MKSIMKKSLIFLVIASLLIIGVLICYHILNDDEQKEVMIATSKKDLNTAESHIYQTIKSNYKWSKDVSNPSVIVKDNTVVRAKIKSIKEAVMLDAKEKFSNPYTPYTPVEIEIIETLSGDSLSGSKIVYLNGGNIRISRMMEKLDNEECKKMGIDVLSEEERNNSFLQYINEFDYELQIDEEYILVLTKEATDIYVISANGYGIFKENTADTKFLQNTNTIFLKNVLTGKELHYVKDGNY